MDGSAGQEDHSPTSDLERVVRCRPCGHLLTSSRARWSHEDRHVHDFVNPDGQAFTIRLFAEAPGAVTQGVPQEKTSWFPGTAWVYALCGGCRLQVGWRYGGVADFWGLIADRIVDD